jgi:hypothetical protein
MSHFVFRRHLISGMMLLGSMTLFLVGFAVSASPVDLRIYVQARCHQPAFRLIPAEVVIGTDVQTDSAKATPFVRAMAKNTQTIRLMAADTFVFPGGPVGAPHCDFHHWRVRIGAVTKIVTENPLVIAKLSASVYATAVYYNCTNPTRFPECIGEQPSQAALSFTNWNLSVTPEGNLLGEARNPRAQRVRVQLFNLQGRLLFDRTSEGRQIEEPLRSTGARLTDGVYVYAVTMWTADGKILTRRLGKVSMQR